MKKGFTLIELLSVIILIAVLMMIIVPTVNTSINKSREKAYESQINNIIESSKKWAISHNNLLPINNEIYKLPLSTLIKDEGLSNTKDGKLKNPKDPDKFMEGCVYISYNEEYNQYLYEYKESC